MKSDLIQVDSTKTAKTKDTETVDTTFTDLTKIDTPHDLNDNEEFEVGGDFILDIVQEGTIVAIRGVPSDDELFNLFRVDGIVTTYQILEDHYGIDIVVGEKYMRGKLYKCERSRRSTGYVKYRMTDDVIVLSTDHVVCPLMTLTSKGLSVGDYDDIRCNIW